ncbi:hypothetical protein NDU88_000502 [Pleurodeles waltl]|uniref:Reverse transcriptase/retrotransposon-derived protein RNase H-like domain-containing protein n=1 Tax=Pleurodeles waltl TaxID=8319 RepID=A0AAV7TGI9_PLEWA|nr:hypothetical protein NDU88_000502 [Pleurodeles waltl]
MPKPTTTKQMQRFLGLCNYVRQWVFDYAMLTAPLLIMLKESHATAHKIHWSEDGEMAFQELKKAIMNAPLFGTPDYKKQFYLFFHCNGMTMTAVLTQKTSMGHKPIAYYSGLLDPIMKGHYPCEQAVATAAFAVQKSTTIVMGSPIAYYSGLLDPIMKGHYPCEQALATAAFAVQKSTTIAMGSPLTLYVEHAALRNMPGSDHHLTPHQIVTGRLMPTPLTIARHRTAAHKTAEVLGEEMRGYLSQLLKSAKFFSKKVTQRQKSTTAAQQISPISVGQLVYIQNFLRRCKDNKFEGPYLVTQSTPTAVKVDGRKPWIHLSDIRMAPALCQALPLAQELLQENEPVEK